ncbi:hypothetical protein D9M69_427680 [compost metagenome]
MFSMRAMPSTTVAKMIGANTILMSLMNTSPSGLRSLPMSGAHTPSAMPALTPSNTWT